MYMTKNISIIRVSDNSLFQKRLFMAIVITALLLPVLGSTATTGAVFQGFYQFVYDAATGYLGRGIAITGGLIALGIAAGTGKAVLAVTGILLAIFGALSPSIIDSIFQSAIIP